MLQVPPNVFLVRSYKYSFHNFASGEGEAKPRDADEQDRRCLHPSGQAAHDAEDHVGQDGRRVPEVELGGAQEVHQRSHQQGKIAITSIRY